MNIHLLDKKKVLTKIKPKVFLIFFKIVFLFFQLRRPSVCVLSVLAVDRGDAFGPDSAGERRRLLHPRRNLQIRRREGSNGPAEKVPGPASKVRQHPNFTKFDLYL